MGTLACGSLDTYPADVERIRATFPELAGEIAGFTGIGQIVDWMTAGSDRPAIEMVAMDEFEFDFLVERPRGQGWIAFGVT